MRISDWSSDVCSSDLLLLAGSVSGAAACVAPLVMAQASPTLARSPEPARLNLSGRALRITAPLLQGDINLGDVDMMVAPDDTISLRSEEHTSELQSLMRISYAASCSKKKTYTLFHHHQAHTINPFHINSEIHHIYT